MTDTQKAKLSRIDMHTGTIEVQIGCVYIPSIADDNWSHLGS